VSEFRGVAGCADDSEIGRREKGAGCCFCCHVVANTVNISSARESKEGR
jgi:hypothetical protein